MIRLSRGFVAASVFLYLTLLGISAQAKDLAQTRVDGAVTLFDARGIPYQVIEGVGEQYNPAGIAVYAMAYAGLDVFDINFEGLEDEQKFEASIEWLKVNLKKTKGHYLWQYDFDLTYNDISVRSPWGSAFAQAVGIQALLAHWKQTGDRESLVVAKKAAESLFVPLNEGGFLFSSGDDVWFEEIPVPENNPSHILNGHMRTLLALAELADATGEKRYEEWFVKGSDTLLRWLPLYDAGYWLRYDLNPRKEELLFRLANPYGFANPELAIDRIVLRDPLTGEESVLDVGAQGDAEGSLRIAGNDWGQIEEVDGRTVRRLRPAIGEKQDINSDGQMVSPYSYFYLTLPNRWVDNLRTERFELTVEYFDEQPGNLAVEVRSIAPGPTFRPLADGDLLLSGSGRWRNWKIPVLPRNLGYWVGDSYATKHAQYLKSLASRVPAFSTWVEVAESYINHRESGDDFVIIDAKPMRLPNQTPMLPVYTLDKSGVVTQWRPSAATRYYPDGSYDPSSDPGSPVYSPFIVATQVLTPREVGQGGYVAPDKDQVTSKSALNWFKSENNQVRLGNGSVVYHFEFENSYNDVVTSPGWASSFGQAYVLKALRFALENTEDASLKELLIKSAYAYEVPVSQGGVSSLSKDDKVFFEEVPNATHVLNGHLISVSELAGAATYLDDVRVHNLVRAGVETLRARLAGFDTGYWLRYDSNPKKELLFQIDWLEGERSPLIANIELQSPQFKKKVSLDVARKDAFEGAARISGNDWSHQSEADGRIVRGFLNGYENSREDKSAGMRHQVYMFMPLPVWEFEDYFDVQPHRLAIRYKDVAPGRFNLKVQPIHEGNVLEFVPLRNGVLEMVGDQQWKTAYVEIRPQDMGWYKGPDYQVYEVGQLKEIADITGDWFFSQYAERHEYYLKAKKAGHPVILEPEKIAPSVSLIDSIKKL